LSLGYDSTVIEAPPSAPHAASAEAVLAGLEVAADRGLSDEEARGRLATFGPNRLREEKHEGPLDVFWEEVREPMVLLLIATGVLYGVWGKLTDALTIFFVIVALVASEVFNEYRAIRAISALRTLAEPAATVRRDGRPVEIPVGEVVPGDVVLLFAGRTVPADGRLMEGFGLTAEEAPLSGESAPIDKDANAVLPEDAPLAERRNLVFAGTTITRGRGTAVVVATGNRTEVGRIAALAAEQRPPRTPLQLAMRDLSKYLVGVALGFSVLVPLLGSFLVHQPVRQMILVGLSLAFATIPEELPIIITMVLGLGAYRLSRKHAIVKRLRAVETLGAVTVVATDKTGTLTENRMRVVRVEPENARHALLLAGVLCNDAATDCEAVTRDPLDAALLTAARESGLDVEAIRRAHPLRDEFTFDNDRKRMSVVYQRDGTLAVAVKGAPEGVLAASTRRWSGQLERPLVEVDRQEIMEAATEMASRGLRVIAFAGRSVPRVESRLRPEEAESDLTFIGLAGLADPPRKEAREAIAAARTAGIRPIMVTGDHPLTARAVAERVGLDGGARMLTGPDLDALPDEELAETVREVSIYARTTPEHKLRIVQALRADAEIVAVTGDGINDAPALAAADIGVAMGETGTDVAREAADMVLADDNFATIIRAVEEGRVLFANLRKGVRYYLAVKVALVSVTLLPVLLRVPVPFAPVQIILMELFMDLAASATFVAEPPEAGLMSQPPRDPRQRFMDRSMVESIFVSAAGLFAAVAGAYLTVWYVTGNGGQARTVAFVTWLLGHLFLALNMRSEREPLVQLGPLSNRVMILWGSATVGFVLFATLVPSVRPALKTVPMTGWEWTLAAGTAFAGSFWIEVRKLLTTGRHRGSRRSATGAPR
jgi:Ca2+-transporting ATPase